MGGLKSENVDLSSTEKPEKKVRGNPNLKKGAKNPYYEKGKATETQEKTKNMAENAEVIEDKKQETVQGSDVSGEKKIIPDDLFSDVIPNGETLPLDGEVKKKDYASINDPQNPNKTGDSGGGNNNPPITNVNPESSNNGGGGNGGGDSSSSTITSAPVEGVKTPEQVKTEAEQFVKLLLRGYDKLHAVGRWAGKMDPNDLMLMHQKGKINLDMELPLGTGKIPLRKFVGDYNAQIDEDIIVTEDFKRDITPPLERIAIKRGWGLGDEGTVGLLLAEDLGTKVALLWGLKKSCNMILETCMNIMKAQNEANNTAKESKNNSGGGGKKDEFINDADNWRESSNSGVEDAKEV